MSEAEQVMWGFFNMGRLISAMSFIGTIIAIWLALRIANMTRASEESNIVTKILSSAFGILVLGGAYTGASIGSCLLYTSPSPRDATLSRMPSSA